MKKSTLIGISILSVFVLCSLSYQPIIADRQIDSTHIVDDTKTSDVDIDELKVLYNRLFDFKYQSEDCECQSIGIVQILICTVIMALMLPLGFIMMFILVPFQLENLQYLFDIPIHTLQNIFYAFGCEYVFP